MGDLVSDIVKEHSAKFQSMLQEVQDCMSMSMVGQGPLRDIWLVRFLIGFKWDIKTAGEKYRNMMKYRKEYGLDNIRNQLLEGMKPNQFPGYHEHHLCYQCTFDLVSGRSKNGSPINIEQTPKFDFQGLVNIPPEVSDRYLMHNLEYHFFLLDNIFLQTGRIPGYVKIMDLTSCSMKQVMWIRKWQSNVTARRHRLGVEIMECYPECFHKVCVVNAPMFFTAIWKLVHPFIPARTAEKVSVTSNSSKSKEV
mmetsp:Transcript_35799/g.112009  ORF Transcript_35799/g.112009 Transcript_35799/m.112009 type:complete len:251 (+) Transcript_35799:72-824(+)